MSKPSQRYDCLIIGGGHNGLVAAAYLARGGKKVCVLERRHVLGGCAVTEELWPGFKISVASYVISLFRPEIIRELRLKEYGLNILPRNPSSFTPFPDGRSLLLGPDKAMTRREVSKFSAKDADALPKYEAMLERVADFLEPTLVMTPPNPWSLKPGNLVQLARLGLGFLKLGHDGQKAVEILAGAATPILDRWFESEQLKVTLATDSPGAALVAATVPVTCLTEVPTLADFQVSMVQHIPTPRVAIDRPFEWKRRLLYVKSPRAAGMNYLVVRDDMGGFAQHTPSFSYWSLSSDVKLSERAATFQGQLGIDTDLFVAAPEKVKLFKDAFTHDQCEPIIKGLQPDFRETQVCARVEGQKGQGFLYVVFPRRADEPPPAIESWQGDKGVKVAWGQETHYVLLETTEREVAAGGIAVRASCAVIKVKDPRTFTIALPAGGKASYDGRELDASGPAELVVEEGETRRANGRSLLER